MGPDQITIESFLSGCALFFISPRILPEGSRKKMTPGIPTYSSKGCHRVSTPPSKCRYHRRVATSPPPPHHHCPLKNAPQIYQLVPRRLRRDGGLPLRRPRPPLLRPSCGGAGLARGRQPNDQQLDSHQDRGGDGDVLQRELGRVLRGGR